MNGPNGLFEYGSGQKKAAALLKDVALHPQLAILCGYRTTTCGTLKTAGSLRRAVSTGIRRDSAAARAVVSSAARRDNPTILSPPQMLHALPPVSSIPSRLPRLTRDAAIKP